MVELLVVITIIGILAAVAIPTVSSFLKPSKEKQDEATANDIYTILNLRASGFDKKIVFRKLFFMFIDYLSAFR